MSTQKNSSNYFDELDMWSDTSKSQKQIMSKEPPFKAPPDYDDFFDNCESSSNRQRGRTSRNRSSARVRRKKLLQKIWEGAAILVCVISVVLVVNFLLGSQQQEQPAGEVPVNTSTVALQPTYPVDTAPAVTQTEPVPLPQHEYRYFGRKLNEEQKNIYIMIRDGVSRHDAQIGPFDIINLNDIQLIVQSITSDYPEYFWFNGGYEYLYYDRNTYKECTLTPAYIFNEREYAAYASFVEAATQPVLDQLEGESDYEKVKGVYEYLIDNTIYDRQYMGKTIYEMFHDGRGVCEGYARATQYMLTKLGVETLYCSGMSGESKANRNQWEAHAWNIVKIDGTYYGLDTTWGDPVNDSGIQSKNLWYLNLTDAEMELQHERENWSSYPACNSTQHNYYVYNGRYLDSFDKETVKRWFQEEYTRGGQLEFKCSGESVFQQVFHWLVQNNGIDEVIRTVIPQNEGYQCSYLYNDKLYIFSLIYN